jgi:hypothetical protein
MHGLIIEMKFCAHLDKYVSKVSVGGLRLSKVLKNMINNVSQV